MKYLEYKRYTGTIEYSKEDKLLNGKVTGIKSLLSYEGATGADLETDFGLLLMWGCNGVISILRNN